MQKQRNARRLIAFRVSDILKDRLDAYCSALGLGLTDVFKCFLLGLPGEGMDDRAELLALRTRLDKRIEETTP